MSQRKHLEIGQMHAINSANRRRGEGQAWHRI
jgi:hypothetical protein